MSFLLPLNISFLLPLTTYSSVSIVDFEQVIACFIQFVWKHLLVKNHTIEKPATDLQRKSIDWFLYDANFYWKVFLNKIFINIQYIYNILMEIQKIKTYSFNFYFLDENREICVAIRSSLFGLGIKAILAGSVGISGIGKSKF